MTFPNKQEHEANQRPRLRLQASPILAADVAALTMADGGLKGGSASVVCTRRVLTRGEFRGGKG